MTTSAYMFVALITASGSCREQQIIVWSMPSLELCRAAVNLATKAGGHADCVPMPMPSPNAGRAMLSVIVGKRNVPADPLGPKKCSSSIVLSLVLSRIR